MKRKITHTADRGLEHEHPIRPGIVRNGEPGVLIATGHISAKAFSIPVIGPTQTGVFCLSCAAFTYEHAVMVNGVLIQKASVPKLADHLRGDTKLAQVGKHPAVILVPGR